MVCCGSKNINFLVVFTKHTNTRKMPQPHKCSLIPHSSILISLGKICLTATYWVFFLLMFVDVCWHKILLTDKTNFEILKGVSQVPQNFGPKNFAQKIHLSKGPTYHLFSQTFVGSQKDFGPILWDGLSWVRSDSPVQFPHKTFLTLS